VEIRFLGHSTFELAEGDTRVLIDPFLAKSPVAAVGADEVDPTVIAITHGHFDHMDDAVSIAKRTGATVVAIVEVAGEIAGELGEGHDVRDPNLGGTVEFDWGWIKLVPAWHTGVTPKGTPHTPAGVVVNLGGKTVYALGDTCLFSDMQLVKRRHPIDVALIPIGGHYTMDADDAAEAARLIAATTVIPCHYNSFPPITADANAFKAQVDAETDSTVVILEPGGTFSP